ncbi:hypothetical protein GCM10023347_48600 [Streptomyces chumphonensis]|uniref:Uncharacterized protein n=1 Tax=Streptomyces chumphonensis TaxID=1214925 RepID=A0A927F0M1_9ACTN|nr:hypothetical protein [Streptomyces chumphonensis]MBD3933026.1 hypothetical protein [Streptomyces chumphonensis]
MGITEIVVGTLMAAQAVEEAGKNAPKGGGGMNNDPGATGEADVMLDEMSRDDD